MQTEHSRIIVQRFFAALRRLKADGIIRGKLTFTRRYGINRWNLNTLEKDPSRGIFQVAWLSYLVDDYKVSPMWLLTGDGPFFIDGRPSSGGGPRRGRDGPPEGQNPQNTCKK